MDAINLRISTALRLKSRGFTLLEILLVVLVVGLALSIAVPRLMPDKKAEANRAAQAIFLALERARDEAVFSSATIGVQFSSNALRYQERNANNTNTWNASSRAGLADMTLPDSLLEVEISSAGDAANSAPTRLVFQPAGYGVPATLTLKFVGGDMHRIVINPICAIVLNPAKTLGVGEAITTVAKNAP